MGHKLILGLLSPTIRLLLFGFFGLDCPKRNCTKMTDPTQRVDTLIASGSYRLVRQAPLRDLAKGFHQVFIHAYPVATHRRYPQWLSATLAAD